MAIKSLDSLSTDTFQMRVKSFLVGCVVLLQKLAVSAAGKSDNTRALDSRFVLARTTLNAQDPRVYVPAFEHPGSAISILDSVPQGRRCRSSKLHVLHIRDIPQHFRITLSGNTI